MRAAWVRGDGWQPPVSAWWAALGLLCGAATALAQPTQYVNSREIVLSAQGRDAGPLTGVDVWVSTDRGANWRSADVSAHSASSVTHTAPGDGTYGFFVVLRNAAGASSDPPTPGDAAQLYVVVDTTPPTLQIHDVERAEPARPPIAAGREGSADDARTSGADELSLRVTVVDEHLAPLAVRVFYRVVGSPRWENLPATLAEGWLRCAAPPADVDTIDLRVVAQDRAGNTATDERRDVALANLTSPSTTQPAATPPTKPSLLAAGGAIESNAPTGALRAAADVAQLPAADTTPHRAAGRATKEAKPTLAADIAEAGMRPDADDDARRTVTTAPVRDLQRAAELRAAAKIFSDAGKFELAIARLEDALAAAGGDLETLVELGACLVRVGRHDEARTRYEAALATRPDDARALEGLALAEATQRRYREAREALVRLCALQPERGQVWLNRGDIEYRLGNTDAARAAWKHVLGVRDADDVQRAGARRRIRLLLNELPASAPPRGP